MILDQVLSILFGLLASYLQGNKGQYLSKRVKYIIALSACVLAGAFTHGIQLWTGGTFSWQELLANIGIAFATSQTYYNTYFKLKN